MIKHIERFCTELQVRALGNVELLFHRDVEICQWRADYGILRQISEGAHRRQDEHVSDTTPDAKDVAAVSRLRDHV